MQLECHACGARFRSMTAEARHRHNFPALCKRNKRFARFAQETNVAAMKAKWDSLAPGQLCVIIWSEPGSPFVHTALFRREDNILLARRGTCLAGTTARVDGQMNSAADVAAGQHTYALADDWFEKKMRIDVPTADEIVQYEMLLVHGEWERAFETIGFGPTGAKLSGYLT